MPRTTSRRGHAGPAPKRAVRNMLRNFAASNKAESRHVPVEVIERQVRAQVQRDQPDLLPAEVERRVARRMEHGLKPH